MPRRILLLITDLEIGGTPSVVRELAVRLHDPPSVIVEVACLAGWGGTADQMRDRGISVTALNARGLTDLGVLKRLSDLIQRGKYDTVLSFLVHANAAAAMMRFPGVRFIQSIQTTQAKPAWHWWVQGMAARKAERVLVPSESVEAAAMDWAGIDGEKIVVIPNAVEAGEFARSRAAAEGATPFPIGFVGRLDPIKQVPVLVRQFAVLQRERDVVLHIYGDGEDRGRVEKEILKNGLGGEVFLHGVVAKPQAAMEGLGMLVLPSQAEGFGLVLIEAMAAGVPVVANKAPGICDVVRDGKTGLLVNVANGNDLAEAMRRLIDNRGLRARLIENGLGEVKRKFSWKTILPTYRNLLELEN